MTAIEWTHLEGFKGETWNPTTGCDKVSPGCGLPRFEGDDTGGCYALSMAKRLKAMGQAKYQNDGDPRTSGPGFGLTLHPDTLGLPFRWRDPRCVFVNSMSDLGHARVPREFTERVWAVMAATPRHTYQVLSKRPERLRRLLSDECRCGAGHPPGTHFRSGMAWAGTSHSPTYVPGVPPDISHRAAWPLPNVWVGSSIELDGYTRRADDLRATPAAIRFLSLEPLLGPLPSLNLTGIDWILLGGESGPRARELDLRWVRDLMHRARVAGAAVFVKQLGSRWATGRGLRGDPHGTGMESWPADLRIREYPSVPSVVAA
jgi:protein gp37